MKFSVVLPTYNEVDNVSSVHQDVVAVMEQLSPGEYEVIFVNDGSTDGTLGVLKKLSPIVIVDLQRNYGQTTALDAGFRQAQGEFVVTLDADGQNDPHDIPHLMEKLEKDNLDVVAGWRKERHDTRGIRLMTTIGRFFRRILASDPIHDSGCTLRVYRKKAVKSLDIQGEMHRYIMTLLRWKGFRIGELEVNHRPRLSGQSKYNYKKAIKGFVDLIYTWFINKYYQRPLHLFGFVGIILFILGVMFEIWVMYEKITRNIDLSDNGWFILGFFLILSGVMFFSFGITLDLLIRTAINTSPHEQRYYIRDVYHTRSE